MLTCKRATELISQSRDEPISIREKLLLHFHMRICVLCKNFKTHLAMLGKLARSDELKETASGETEKMPDEAKKKLLENLKKQL